MAPRCDGMFLTKGHMNKKKYLRRICLLFVFIICVLGVIDIFFYNIHSLEFISIAFISLLAISNTENWILLKKIEKEADNPTSLADKKQHQMNTILDSLQIIIYLKDTRGSYIRGNQEFLKLIGCTENDNLNEKVKSTYTENFLKEANIEDTYIIKEKIPLSYTRRVSLPGKDEQWFNINKAPIFDENGHVTGIVVSCQNINKEKEAIHQKETYVATLTHDLKTPTIAQIRSLELLSQGAFGMLTPKQNEIVVMTLESCKFMLEMISTILFAYKYENDEVKINPEDFSIVNLTMESCKAMEPLAKNKNMQIIIKPDRKNDIIYADPIQIKKVINNLLSNSISYACENSEIEIQIKNLHDNVEFLVKNESSYIPPSTMKNIFNKYVTHKSKFNKIGVGLGLYSSRKIIENHGGSMIAESMPNNEIVFGFKMKKKQFVNNCAFVNPF